MDQNSIDAGRYDGHIRYERAMDQADIVRKERRQAIDEAEAKTAATLDAIASRLPHKPDGRE